MATRLVLLGLLLFSLSGCGDSGPKVAPVSGKITFKGKPYTKAMITFQPRDGGPQGFGRTNEQGEFSILTGEKKGAVLGTHKVTIVTIPDPVSPAANSEMRSDDPAYAALSVSKESDYAKAAATPKEPIPAKYNSSSDLIYTVQPGNNAPLNVDIP
ncbi:MAG: hypothetical protein U0930_14055 [Pirellulales bacterium]